MAPVVTLCKTVNHQLAPSTWPRCPGTSQTLDRQILRLGTFKIEWHGSSSRSSRRSSSQADNQPIAPDTAGAQQTEPTVPVTPQINRESVVQEPVRASSSATARQPQAALDEEWNPAADWAEEWAEPDISVPSLQERAAGAILFVALLVAGSLWFKFLRRTGDQHDPFSFSRGAAVAVVNGNDHEIRDRISRDHSLPSEGIRYPYRRGEFRNFKQETEEPTPEPINIADSSSSSSVGADIDGSSSSSIPTPTPESASIPLTAMDGLFTPESEHATGQDVGVLRQSPSTLQPSPLDPHSTVATAAAATNLALPASSLPAAAAAVHSHAMDGMEPQQQGSDASSSLPRRPVESPAHPVGSSAWSYDSTSDREKQPTAAETTLSQTARAVPAPLSSSTGGSAAAPASTASSTSSNIPAAAVLKRQTADNANPSGSALFSSAPTEASSGTPKPMTLDVPTSSPAFITPPAPAQQSPEQQQQRKLPWFAISPTTDSDPPSSSFPGPQAQHWPFSTAPAAPRSAMSNSLPTATTSSPSPTPTSDSPSPTHPSSASQTPHSTTPLTAPATTTRKMTQADTSSLLPLFLTSPKSSAEAAVITPTSFISPVSLPASMPEPISRAVSLAAVQALPDSTDRSVGAMRERAQMALRAAAAASEASQRAAAYSAAATTAASKAADAAERAAAAASFAQVSVEGASNEAMAAAEVRVQRAAEMVKEAEQRAAQAAALATAYQDVSQTQSSIAEQASGISVQSTVRPEDPSPFQGLQRLAKSLAAGDTTAMGDSMRSFLSWLGKPSV